MKKKNQQLPALGWREWLALPQLGLPLIRAKVDTGARTSALHAFYVEPYEEEGNRRVRFGVHPKERDMQEEIHCSAPIVDERVVSDSGGHEEKRFVIMTPVVLGKSTWEIEVTLTNRDSMRYRMLLGRTAIADSYLVDSGVSHLMGKPDKHPDFRPALGFRHDEEE